MPSLPNSGRAEGPAVATGFAAYPEKAASLYTRVLVAGAEGPTVLFLHGAGARADRWRESLAVVAARGFRCMAIDLPGHGFAQKGSEPHYGVPAFANFVEAFLDLYGIDRLHLVGTSLGAHTLGEVVCRNPYRALSLTLIGGTGLFPIASEACEALANSIADQSFEGTERKLRRVLYDHTRLTPEFICEEWLINNSPGAIDAFDKLAAYFRTDLNRDAIGERLAQLSHVPMKLLWGEHDISVPVSVGQAASELLDRPLALIPDGAHAPYLDNPEYFNATLIEFLTSEAAQK